MARPKKVVENHEEVEAEVEETSVETHEEKVEKKKDEKQSNVELMAYHPKFAKFKIKIQGEK